MRISNNIIQIDAYFYDIHVALYLIKGERVAIIDTGNSDTPQNYIAPAIRQHGLNIENINLILNTHAHWDHTTGNQSIKKASNANILIHADDVNIIENHENYFQQHLEPGIKAIMGNNQVQSEKDQFMKMAGPDQIVDQSLNDNDVVYLGDGCNLRVIHLPGHSYGSVGFYWEKEGILFSGDSLPGLQHNDGGIPIIRDLIAYYKSLERIESLSLELILQGHDFRGIKLPASTSKRHGEIKEFIRDSKEITERLIEAIDKVAPYTYEMPFSELYNRVIEMLPGKMGFKPIDQIQIKLFSPMTIFDRLRQLNFV